VRDKSFDLAHVLVYQAKEINLIRCFRFLPLLIILSAVMFGGCGQNTETNEPAGNEVPPPGEGAGRPMENQAAPPAK